MAQNFKRAMNTSSKYANLPFIASGEKDVYETDDLPESDQRNLGKQDPVYDASIEIIPSGTVNAFNKFALVDSERSLEKDSKFSELSVIDRIKQIQNEIEELQKSSQQEPNISGEIDNLFSNLENLYDVCFKKFNFSDSIEEIKTNRPNENDQGPSLIYELYQKPEREEILQTAKLNSIQQRLNRIEKTLGINDSMNDYDHPLLNNYLKDQSIMNIVINMSNKIVQLDDSSLDRMDARLNLINEKLNQILDKKSALTELDKEDKLNEIYDSYVKVDKNRSLIPHLLERVQLLNDLQQRVFKHLERNGNHAK
ncbi:hypothetical protein SSS_06475 [Sarcoptes scabiei]|nr:hypothetical protein SSS_06475 [Sarcoptes scabiei]